MDEVALRDGYLGLGSWLAKGYHCLLQGRVVRVAAFMPRPLNRWSIRDGRRGVLRRSEEQVGGLA